MTKVLDVMKALMIEAKIRSKEQENRYRSKAPHYKKGDQVWLSSSNIKTQYPMLKLSDIWLELYMVTKIYNYLCIFKLDPSSHLCKVFYNSLLQPVKRGFVMVGCRLGCSTNHIEPSAGIPPDLITCAT